MFQKVGKHYPSGPGERKSSWTNVSNKRKSTFQLLARGPRLLSQETALNFHVGLVGSTVAAQLPLVDATPDQHPIDNFQKTLETSWDLTEAIHRLWESLANGTETAQQLSDRCHYLHTGVVKRVPGADYPESEDAQPNTRGIHG